MLIFYFLEKGLGLAFPSHLVCDFSRKMFYMLHAINWPHFIAWLPLLLKILVNNCIVVVCFPACDVANFEIDLIFLITPFFYLTKKSRKKIKYLEKKKNFKREPLKDVDIEKVSVSKGYTVNFRRF